MRVKKQILFFLILFLVLLFSAHASAKPVINITVKTILASQEGGRIDSSLQNITRDYQSVFKYSSYKALGQDNLRLDLNETGSVTLPGNRVLKITPNRIAEDRATLALEIFSQKRSIFQTVIKLRNKSSITVGGPKHKDGYLMFNIYNSF